LLTTHACVTGVDSTDDDDEEESLLAKEEDAVAKT